LGRAPTEGWSGPKNVSVPLSAKRDIPIFAASYRQTRDSSRERFPRGGPFGTPRVLDGRGRYDPGASACCPTCHKSGRLAPSTRRFVFQSKTLAASAVSAARQPLPPLDSLPWCLVPGNAPYAHRGLRACRPARRNRSGSRAVRSSSEKTDGLMRNERAALSRVRPCSSESHSWPALRRNACDSTACGQRGLLHAETNADAGTLTGS
jgi:hypothetical protein